MVRNTLTSFKISFSGDGFFSGCEFTGFQVGLRTAELLLATGRWGTTTLLYFLDTVCCIRDAEALRARLGYLVREF